MFGYETCKTLDTHFVVVVVAVRVWVATRFDEIDVKCDWRVCHSAVDVSRFDHRRFENPLDKIKMAPATGVKRKRVEVESSEFNLFLLTQCG